MKKRKIGTVVATWVLSVVAGLSLTAQEASITTLEAADFGIRPVSGQDSGRGFATLLQQAREVSSKGDSLVIHFAPGVYTIREQSLPRETLFISNHDHVAERAVALFLHNLHHTRIEAKGVTFLLHGQLLPVVIKGCGDLTLSGLTLDYPAPTLTQLEILAVEGDEVVARLPEETRFRIEDKGKIVLLLGEGRESRVRYSLPFASDGHMKAGRADVAFDPHSIRQLDEHRVAIKGWAEAPHLEVGDRYALRSGARPTPAITVIDSERIGLEGVTVHFADGMGLVAQDTRDISLDHFAVKRREGSERYFTLQADATHFSNCRGHIRSVNGLYEGMADDAINVHGVYLRVDSLLPDRSVLATFAHPQAFGLTWGAVGDTVRLVDRETLLPLLTTTISAITARDPHHKVIRLGDPLPNDLPAEMALENYSAMPSVYFANNVVRDNRARGALFSTHQRVICRDNLFDHTHGSAILLSGDANGWYESGPCEEVLITGNHFINALTARYQFTEGVISIFPVLRKVVPGKYYHGRVAVEGNTFDTFPSPLLYALSVRELVWRDNLVRLSHDYAPLFDDLSSRLINVGTAVVDRSATSCPGKSETSAPGSRRQGCRR